MTVQKYGTGMLSVTTHPQGTLSWTILKPLACDK